MGAAASSVAASETLAAAAPEEPKEEEAEVSSEEEGNLEAALGDLWDRRAEIEAARDGEADPFLFTVRGGKWTRDRKGVSFDSWRSFVAPGEPQRFCRLCRMPTIATFAIPLYGEELCLSCASIG